MKYKYCQNDKMQEINNEMSAKMDACMRLGGIVRC